MEQASISYYPNRRMLSENWASIIIFFWYANVFWETKLFEAFRAPFKCFEWYLSQYIRKAYGKKKEKDMPGSSEN